MFGKDRELSNDLRQLAIARRIKGEFHVALAGPFRLHNMLEIKRILRAIGFERFKRKNHIFGCDRLAILPFCIGAQAIGDGCIISRES